MEDCLFCKIVSGKVPCFKIYEDELTLAFLDISPSRVGHTLVVPKQHVRNLLTADADIMAAVMATTQKVSNHYTSSCGFGGVHLGVNNEPCAGQVVMHWHVHIVPYTKAKQKVHNSKTILSAKELEPICERLKMY